MPKLHRLVQHPHRKQFQTLIFSWWASHKRDLPWRRTHDPYKILVSEIMLQQTQVSRVLPKYKDFLTKFPDIQSLAGANTADVLRAWKGLGYNRRALYLKKTADAITNNWKGKFPKSENELVKLPGLGKYTARAILVFAYEKDIPLVDTNIRQIITHYFFDDMPQKDSVIWETAEDLLPRGKSWKWHQALMDYGATELQKIPGIIKKQKKFKGSNRFYRGRIIDLLRKKSYTTTQLIRYLRKKYTKSESDIRIVLDGLIREGLVCKNTQVLQLPD